MKHLTKGYIEYTMGLKGAYELSFKPEFFQRKRPEVMPEYDTPRCIGTFGFQKALIAFTK